MNDVTQIVSAEFPDGVRFNLIMYPDGQYESYVFSKSLNSDFLTKHETLEEGLKFIADWSKEILNIKD